MQLFTQAEELAIILCGYLRKSSESEDRQVQSIERQEDDFWDSHEKEKFQVYCDPIKESKSAFSPGREGFAKLIQLTFEGKINAWWVWHPNRLARNPIDAGQIIYLMDLGKLAMIKTPTRTYLNTPVDKMMLQIEFTMSKKDSDDKSVFVKSGLKKRYKKGYPNGVSPIGFINDKSEEKGNRGWLVDNMRLKQVKQLFELFLTGRYSVSSITDYARNQLKLTTMVRKGLGGKLVCRSYVHKHILLNPIYAGFFFAADEKGIPRRYELASKLPRIISEDDHKKIKAILGRQNISKRQKYEPTYTGLIISPYKETVGADHTINLICDCKHKFSPRNKEKCPKCGRKIDRLKEPKYYSYVHYYNVTRRKTKGIKAKTIREKKIDEFLLDYYKKNLHLSQPFMDWLLKQLSEIRERELASKQLRTQCQEHYRDQIEAEKKKLREMYRKNMISEGEYKLDVEELNQKLIKTPKKPKEFNWLKEAHEIFSVIPHLVNVMENGTSAEKKNILPQVCSNLLWNEKKLSVINLKPVQTLIDVLNSAKAQNPAFEPAKIVDITSQNKVFEDVRPVLLRGLDDVRTQFKGSEIEKAA